MDLPSGTVTFLFTDIEGSTKLSQQYPDAMPDCGVGVGFGTGLAVKTIVAVKGLSAGITDGVFVCSVVIGGDSWRTVAGILVGSPRSMKMSLLAADKPLKARLIR